MNEEDYKKFEAFPLAIDILADESIDKEAVLRQIAKTHPDILVFAVNTIDNIWQIEARNIYKSSGKITAIKHIRDITGMDLKESKNLVESWDNGKS